MLTARSMISMQRKVLMISLLDTQVLNTRWDDFVTDESRETIIWVWAYTKPDGRLDDELVVQLHWLTFNSANSGRATSDTKDLTNPCTRAVAQKFQQMPYLSTEAYFRRAKVTYDRTKTPIDIWHNRLLKVHEQFADFIWQRSTAKVWLICGERKPPEVFEINGSFGIPGPHSSTKRLLAVSFKHCCETPTRG